MKVFKSSSKEVALKQSERLSQIFDSLHSGADSVSIKAVERISGIKEKSDRDMVKAALNKVGGNSSASCSIRFTFGFAEAHEDEITSIVTEIHKYNDKSLQECIEAVPDLNRRGRTIAIQNHARQLLNTWADTNGYNADQIDLAMEVTGNLLIPEGGIMEASITMGTMVDELPNYQNAEKHYKAKTITLSDGRTLDKLVKVSESYGRSKIPFSVEYKDQFVDKIIHFAELFENSMADSKGTDEDNLECLQKFASLLAKETGGYQISTLSLNEDDNQKAQKIAEDVKKYLVEGK